MSSVVDLRASCSTFQPKLEKFLKIHSKKFLIFSKKNFFLYFREWNFLAPALKKFLYFPKKIFLIFWEMEFSSPKIKKFQEGTFRA